MLLAILANAITLERVYKIEFEVDSLEDEVKMVMDRGICTLYNLKQTLHAGAYPVFSEGGGGGEIRHLGLCSIMVGIALNWREKETLRPLIYLLL